jgi:hypothetical protein
MVQEETINHFILNLLTGTTVTQERVFMIPTCCLRLESVNPQGPLTANNLQNI